MDAAYALVERAIFLMGDDPGGGIAALATRLGVGHSVLDRAFRRSAGLGPKQFQQVISIGRAGRALSYRPVLQAALEAGLSGPGRLHDRCLRVEAVTPGAIRAGGAGLVFRHGAGSTPLGPAAVVWTAAGIHRLLFGGYDLADLRDAWPQARLEHDPVAAQELLARVFARAHPGRFRLHLVGTAFQIAVWRALLAIPAGETRTYAELAAAAGRPGAARAAGTAAGANPVAVLIPCHRVIRACGALGGYRWGLGRKACLLAGEAIRSCPDTSGAPPQPDGPLWAAPR